MTLPLSRNSNFRLLWGSQVLSEFGGSASAIAFPLLVLAVTGSPGAAGLVLSTSAAAHLLFALPMGALADRWNRKKIMLGCKAAEVIAAASLVGALLCHAASLVQLIVLAALMGMSGTLFAPAEDAY